jgi:MoaA/NifB/PqqE/SkfB family radical SAM enzyme
MKQKISLCAITIFDCEFKELCGGYRARALSLRWGFLEEEPYRIHKPKNNGK